MFSLQDGFDDDLAVFDGQAKVKNRRVVLSHQANAGAHMMLVHNLLCIYKFCIVIAEACIESVF